MIDPPTVPPELVHVKLEPAGSPVRDVHESESVERNPEPVKPTLSPGKATFGVIVI